MIVCKISGWPLRHLLICLTLPFVASAYSAPSDGAAADAEYKQSDKYGLTFALDTFLLSEPVSIDAALDDWETNDFDSGERIYAKLVFRSGVRYKKAELGYTSRAHYYLDFSKDTATWHYMEKNERENELKQTLDIYLDANYLNADGYYFSHQFGYRSLRVLWRLSYLHLKELTYGSAQGVYDPTLDFENRTKVTIDYAYSEDSVLDRRVEKPDGHGWIFDLALNWDWREHSVSLELNDLYSRLDWSKAPASKIIGNLENLDIRRDAALNFKEFYSEIRQPLPTHSRLRYHYSTQTGYLFGIEREELAGKSWEKLFVGKSFAKDLRTTLYWSPTEETVGFSLGLKNLSLSLETDNSDFEKAHIFNFALGAQLTF